MAGKGFSVKKTFLEAGKVRNTHALQGEVKAECWLEGEKPFAGVKHLYLSDRGEGELEVSSVRRQGEIALVRFAEIDTVEKATLLKGKTLYAARNEIDPKDEKVYFADLIGLPLIEEGDGKVYGTISQVESRGASELFLVRLSDGKEAYFPAVKEFVVRMDANTGVFVRAPKGIFD